MRNRFLQTYIIVVFNNPFIGESDWCCERIVSDDVRITNSAFDVEIIIDSHIDAKGRLDKACMKRGVLTCNIVYLYSSSFVADILSLQVFLVIQRLAMHPFVETIHAYIHGESRRENAISITLAPCEDRGPALDHLNPFDDDLLPISFLILCCGKA